jgi:PAS domain S-box-containing protein
MSTRKLLVCFIISLLVALAYSPSLRAGDDLQLLLTAEERAWLAEHPKIVVGGEVDWAPFDFVDKSGQHAGITNDYLQVITGELGLEIEIITDPSWDKLLGMMRRKEIDVLPAIYYSSEREQFLNYTAPYARVTEFIYARDDTSWISTIDDLKGKRVAVVKGYTVENVLRSEYPDIGLVTAPNILACLKKLVLGEVDAFIGDIASTSYNIRTYYISGIKPIAPGPFPEPSVHMGIRDDWPVLRDMIQKVLVAMPEERHAAIRGRWFSEADGRTRTVQAASAPGGDISTDHSVWWIVAAGVVLLVLLIPVLLQRLGGDREGDWFSSATVRRIGAVAVALFLGVVMVLAWYSLEKVQDRLRGNIGNQLSVINNSVHQALQVWFEGRRVQLLDLAHKPEVLEAATSLLAVPRNPQALRTAPAMKRLRTLLEPRLDHINARGIFIIAPDRVSIASMRDTNLGTLNLIAQQRSELVDRAFAGETVFIPPIVSDVPLRDQHGQLVERAPTTFFMTPLLDANGGVIAVFTVRFDPTLELTRITETGRPGESGETYAIDKNGRLLTTSRFAESLIEASIVTGTGTGKSGLQAFRVADPGGNLLSGHVPESGRAEWPLTLMASEVTSGHSGMNVAGYRDYRGVTVIGAWLWSKDLGIGLTTEIDVAEALAPYRALRNLVIGALGVTVLLALALAGLSVWLGDRAKERLERLVEERTRELNKLAQAVEQSPLCVVITDVDGNIEHVNPTFTRVTGYQPGEVIGRNPRLLKSGETSPDQYASLWGTILDGKVWHSEIRNRRKSGEIYWGSISIAPVTDDAGTVTHFVAMTEDITEAKEVELALQEARERNNLILDSAGEGIFGLDAEGRVTFCNRAAADMLGYRPDELLGRPMHESVHYAHPDGADYDVVDCPMRAAFQDGVTHHIDGEVLWRKDGTAFPVEYSATPISHDGNLVGAVVVFHDITARQAAATEIKRINFLSDIALELTGSGYWHVDYSDPDYYYQSERAARILGEPVRKDGRYHLQDEWFSRLVEANPETAEKTAERYQGAIDGKYPSYNSIYAYKRPIDGKIVWVHAAGKIVRDEDDKIRYMYGAYQDITAQKEAAEALAKAKEAADAANQAKSAFLANMSHELRTPMNAILGYSEMLIEEAEDLEQEDFIPDLQKINKAGTHLLALINDVLDLAKVESGRMEAFAEDIDIDSLIDEVSGTAHPLMEKNNNTLSIERGKELGKAHQDLTKLRQTLFNLLSNAAKFTHDGTITLHANRTEQAGVDWLTLAVSDTGIGIAADKIEHIFEEFTQADGSTTRDYGGTGLGLAISRRFCKMLGGDLTAHSELGEGSTFTIRIPAILPEEQVLHPSADAVATPDMAETELESLRKAGPGSTILVIDDDPEACEIIERYLTKDGYRVATAASGEQGLRLAHEIKPAAITLDVMMPEMDGWSVLRALKADPVLRTIPVVMLTMIDDRTRGYSLGAVDYLTKPVDREQLNKALSRYYCAEEDICPVLLVEDDIETREVMARALEKAGWTISEAGNGQEALDIMSGLQPRLILLDLMMPVMDGFDFLAEMRTRPEWQQIPVIVMTAKDLTADDRDRLSGKVEEVLEKNAYTRDQLLERVSEAIVACNTNT